MRRKINIGKVKFTTRQQEQWFALLVELVNSGFSLKEAVAFSISIYPQLKPVMTDIQLSLNAGNSFANAIRKWVPLDTYYQICLAEEHGQLFETLRYFSVYLKARRQQINKLKQLLEYPLLLLALLAGVIVIIMNFVLPQLRMLNDYSNPLVAPSLISILAGIIGSLLTISFFKFIRYHKQTKINKVRQLCKCPFIGKIIKHYYGYYICTNLSLLIRQGLSLQEILLLCKTFKHDSLLFQMATELEKYTVRGLSINHYIKREIFVPNELSVFLRQGSTNEKLGLHIKSYGQQLFKKLIAQCEHNLTFIQPLIYLIIAAIIVYLYLQILLPVYNSVQVIK